MPISKDALWASGHDESVEVNQRALIDKVLARYSGEFTIFRELLQNSDDAQSKAVEIHFETKEYAENKPSAEDGGGPVPPPKMPNLKTTLIHQWRFKNNGILFREEDWSRLRKIAEGNPDEEKIGAFGVGFYSLFSVTEEPFVTSGDKWMGFYWKDNKDQLFARRGNLPPDQAKNEWTSFDMPLREPAPMPSAFDLCRFLASSITFMVHLNEVSVYIDDKRLSRLTKSAGSPHPLPIPSSLNRTSPQRTMRINGLQSTSVYIKAEVMRLVYESGSEKPPPPSIIPKVMKPSGGLFSSLGSMFSSITASAPSRQSIIAPPQPPPKPVDLLSVGETSVTLVIFSASVDVTLDKKMAAELHRSTKKNAPSKVRYDLIYTGKEEYDASVEEDKKHTYATGSIFQELRADLEGAGSAHVSIGHRTAQTTGLGGHMAARFIPTVERESIDLVDRNVAIWNKELLYVGGFLSRSAYELEMDKIAKLWEGASTPTKRSEPELQTWLFSKALHLLKFFSFYPSTPSADVSDLMKNAFFSCGNGRALSFMSTMGVKDASMVRMPAEKLEFLRELCVVPQQILMNVRPETIDAVRRHGFLKDIQFPDVAAELRARPLDQADMLACLKWWKEMVDYHSNRSDWPMLQALTSQRNQLLNSAILILGVPGNANERVIPMSTIKTFLNKKASGGATFIPLNGPLPDDILPYEISKEFSAEALQSTFGWAELTVLDWLRFLITEVPRRDPTHNVSAVPTWAEEVLLVLSKAWPSLSNGMKAQIITMLKDNTCIPTSAGMMVPAQSYFASADIFHDLPVATMPSGSPIKGPLEKVLTDMGVRKHLSLELVFERMIKTGSWTAPDLVKYLVSVKATLTADEWQRLKQTRAFLAESGPENTRYMASDLYEPSDALRQLGLPIVKWGPQPKWRSNSDSGTFMYEIGLRRCPQLEILIKLCTSADASLRKAALAYLLDNMNTHYSDNAPGKVASTEIYHPSKFKGIAYVPAVKNGREGLAGPTQVFSESQWGVLGFMTVAPGLSQEAATKLQLPKHPWTRDLATLLQKDPPRDEVQARQWFSIIGGRVADFSSTELETLSRTAFIPVRSEKGIRYYPPTQCFFGGNSTAQFHSKLFIFVDFGNLGNALLAACGSKQEPSVEQIVQMLLADPHKFYDLAESRENFLLELRNIAVNSRLLSPTTLTRMKRAPILLGLKRQRRQQQEKKSNAEDPAGGEDWSWQYDLLKAEQIVVADDPNAYHLFGEYLFSAPQEDVLEEFYIHLGSRKLSTVVKEEYKTGPEMLGHKYCTETRSLVLERLPLFLHEHEYARNGKIRIKHDWLNAGQNFTVRVFGNLTVTKSFSYAGVSQSRPASASAVAHRLGSNGPLQLWIAANVPRDMYEIAISLCRHLFVAPKASDALLFMTLLSTDHDSLRRRGYNVDRIIKRQRAEKEKEAKEQELLSRSRPPPNMTSQVTDLPPQPKPVAAAPTLPPVPPPKPRNSSWGMNMLDKVTGKHPERPSIDKPLLQNQEPAMPGASSPPRMPGAFGGPRPGSNANGVRGNEPTPQGLIDNNIDMAIKDCKPDRSGNHVLENRTHMQRVKESLEDGYCDISGRVGDIKQISTVDEIKIYASLDVNSSILAAKHASILRFISLIKPLRSLYGLHPQSLHIFYDTSGDTIAFNRNASLFLNLRFFEAWHDEQVRSNIFKPAYISWYFTLAHEIAHNLVQPHNSEHEFYFSAICEKYFLQFGHLMSGLPG